VSALAPRRLLFRFSPPTFYGNDGTKFPKKLNGN